MRKLILLAMVAMIATIGAVSTAVTATAATCTPTGFFRDGINMTAAATATTGQIITGEVDATGCNIAIYVGPGVADVVVNEADVHGANYFGVLVRSEGTNDASADITSSQVHDIGESPRNGSQHGVGIHYRSCEGGSTNGNVKGNAIWNYQKGGIVVNCDGASASVTNNSVAGADLSYATAANSVQFGFGAGGSLENNIIGGNQWCGPSDYVATAVLLYDSAPGTVVRHNNIRGNSDVGIYALLDDSVIDNNRIFDDAGDCNARAYDIGLGNYGDNAIANNKSRGFDTPYEGVDPLGTNKVVPSH